MSLGVDVRRMSSLERGTTCEFCLLQRALKLPFVSRARRLAAPAGGGESSRKGERVEVGEVDIAVAVRVDGDEGA